MALTSSPLTAVPEIPPLERAGLLAGSFHLTGLGVSSSAYVARLAQTKEDREAAQRLRYEVFNLELSEGLEASTLTGLDADPFDEVCDHLVAQSLKTGEIVGTYRLQTGPSAAAHRGYYSAQEFDLTALEPYRHEIVELGRACIAKPHRNLAVLNLIWRGLAAYAHSVGARYLIGCSSVNSTDPRVEASLYSSLMRTRLAAPEFQVRPWPDWACPLDSLAALPPKLPKLLAAYLALGAKIGGAPAVDRQFKTIDFLTLCDLTTLSARTAGRYLNSPPNYVAALQS